MAFATVAGYIYRRLRAIGMTIEAICAILAQIQKESGFLCNNVENAKGWTDEGYTIAVDTGNYRDFATDEIGYGLYQLTHPLRKKAFWDYIRNRGCSIADLEAQVDFLIYEMQQSFPSIWRMMLSSHDLYACTKELLYKWENPQEKEENLKERYTYAQKWLDMARALEASGELNQSAAPAATNDVSHKVATVSTGSAIGKVLALAKSEVGYHEKANNSMLDEKAANPGSGNFTKYGRDLDAVPTFYNGKKNGYAWCDQFVDWLFFKCFGAETAMQMLCQPQNSAGAGCEYSKNYYASQGRYDRNPHTGDQIFFYDDSGSVNHTGIVESVENGRVNTIEGNSTDRVQRQSYPIDSGYIAGYGHPKWELVGDSVPTGQGSSDADTPSTSEKYLLYEGMVGSKVELLQTILTKLGYDIGPNGIDGEYGDDTKYAVMTFQRDNGLMVSGGVDEETTQALNKAYSALGKPSTSSIPSLKFNKGDIVAFTGSKQYLNSTTTHNRNAKPGTAKVTRINAGDPHPYHLVRVVGGGSNIYGWANENDISVKV